MPAHPFAIVYASSEDAEAPAHNLASGARTWQSQRFPSFPLDVVLEFRPRARVGEIQLRACENRAPSVVDVFVGDARSGAGGTAAGWADAAFALVGSIDFAANAGRVHGRLLLPAPVDCQFLKMVFQGTSPDSLNPCEQVGIETLLVVATPAPAYGSGAKVNNDQRSIDREAEAVLAELGVLQSVLAQDASLAGAQYAQQSGRNISPAQDMTSTGAATHFPATDSMMQLMQQRDRIVELKAAAALREDYAEAARIRILVDWFTAALAAVQTLEERKLAAVDEEDFEEARKCKTEIDRILQGATLKSREAGISPSSNAHGSSDEPSRVHSIKTLIATRMAALENAKVKAVSDGEFGAASRMKAKQDALKIIENDADQLLRELQAALRVEDYHSARQLGDRLVHLADRVGDVEFDPVDQPLRAPVQPPLPLQLPTPPAVGRRHEPESPAEPPAAPALHQTSMAANAEDRPIRPMRTSQADEHNFSDDRAPAAASSSSPKRAPDDQNQLTPIIQEVFGGEVAEGINSASWANREKAVQSATALLRTGSIVLAAPAMSGARTGKGSATDRPSQEEKMMSLLSKGFSRPSVATAALIALGLMDKNPQVYFSALRMLQSCIEQMIKWDSKPLRMWLGSLNISPSVTDRVADTSARVRDASIWALSALARAKNISADFVVKSIVTGQAGTGSSRLCIGQVDTMKQIVSDLVGSGTTSEALQAVSSDILNYCGKLFEHPQATVRTASTELVAQIAVVLGKEFTLKMLQADLRPVQLAAVEKAVNDALAKYPSPAGKVSEPGKHARPPTKEARPSAKGGQAANLSKQTQGSSKQTQGSKPMAPDVIEISDDEEGSTQPITQPPSTFTGPQQTHPHIDEKSLENEAGCTIM